MKSMTAFARQQEMVQGLQVVWELRSVNHRYLDVSLRLPESYRSLEAKLRELLRNRMGRGKLEATLKVQRIGNASDSMRLNTAMVDAIMKCSEQLEKQYQLENDLCQSHFLQMPELLLAAELDISEHHEAIISTFTNALDQLRAARAVEGIEIAGILEAKRSALGTCLEEAKAAVAARNEQLRNKLLQRVASLVTDVEPQRFEQELVYFLHKMDVSEELDRIEAHCVQFDALTKKGGMMGRPLDFLMQEFNREANTLCAKSNDTEVTRSAMDMKVLIEQMREQIQNIE